MTRWLRYGLLTGLLLLGAGLIASGAIQQLAGLAGAQSGTKWVNTKDMSVGDGITQGALATANYLFDGSVFNRPRGTIANGMATDVTRVQGNVTVIGATTPSDTFANPTNAQNTFSLGGLWNAATSQWERAQRAQSTSLVTNQTSGVIPGAMMLYNPVGGGVNTYRPARLIGFNRISSISPFALSVNLTANGDTLLDAQTANAAVLGRIVVGVGGTTSTIAVFREPDGVVPCNGTLLGTYSTVTAGTIYDLGFDIGDDFCLTAAGGAAANLTVLWERYQN